ncbi:MAG: alpha/beta hydrolase, partial [Cyanobacteria bacterium P01_H01_bin.121]
MPILILTGTADLQIPVAMGERLYAAASEPKQFVLIQGGGHDNHLETQHQQRVQQFIEQALQE